MKQIVINTYSYRLQLEEYINKRLEELKTKEYKPSINIEEKGKTTFMTCSFPMEIPKSKEQRYFKEYLVIPVAKAIVDIIQKEFAIDYANGIIQTSYEFREVVITGMVEEETETKKLLEPIMNEIIENNTFCLDGWIRFRLSKYRMHMIHMVENLTYEYGIYKEHEEFISLIRAFILEQQSLIDQIHIIPNENGNIAIYDEEKEPVELDMDQYDSQDDLILATLLTLTPLKITIHQEEKCGNLKLIGTIQSIYEDRVTFCTGCKHCKKLECKVRIMTALKDFLTQKKL